MEDTIRDRQFTYTTFLRQCDLPHVSSLKVYQGDADALALLDHRIVLTGGNRTAWPTDNKNPPIGDMLDYHNSPEGPMAGVYFHANYVEGLLDDRIQSSISRCIAALIDMLLATAILLAIHLLQGTLRVVVVSLLIIVPVLIAYVAMVTLGYCFDFVLPVVLTLLHPAIERYLDSSCGGTPMNKHLGTFAISVGSLLFCASFSLTPAASASPMWMGQSNSGTKSNCSTDASGKSSKDCDKISSERMSTKATAGAKTASTSASSSKSASASTSSTNTAAASSSSAAAAAASASDPKPSTKKDADKVSEERMSTRGLKPPPKDSKSDAKDSKGETKSDAATPK